MSWLDWCIVVVPLLIVLMIGLKSQKYVKSVADFLAAGRVAGRYVICVGTGVHVYPEAQKDDMQAALFQTESGVTIRCSGTGSAARSSDTTPTASSGRKVISNGSTHAAILRRWYVSVRTNFTELTL